MPRPVPLIEPGAPPAGTRTGDASAAGAAATHEAVACLSCSWHLAVVEGPDAGAVLALPDGTERVVGRGGTLSDPYTSREHLRVRATARTVTVVGVPGVNGARWQDRVLRGAPVRAGSAWREGRALRVGDTVLQLRRRPDDLEPPAPPSARQARTSTLLTTVTGLLMTVAVLAVVVLQMRSGHGTRSLMLVPLALMALSRLGGLRLTPGPRTGSCGWQGRRPDPPALLLATARRARYGQRPAARADEDPPRAWCGRRRRRSILTLEDADCLALTGPGSREAVRWWAAQVLARGGAHLDLATSEVTVSWGSGASACRAVLSTAPDDAPPATAARVRPVPASRRWRRDTARTSTTWWLALQRLAGGHQPGEGGHGGTHALPGAVRLEEVVGEVDRERLRARWAAGRGTPGTLDAVLGVGPHGPVHVDLVADGPHALVAGTTGSGKSELLTSWLLQLAAAHPPSRLSLVLVDYKGGASFGRLATLAHTAGVLTDLDPAGTSRALASLGAEVRRRERLLAEHGVGDVSTLPPAHGPARLVVVVDEFAVLASGHPEVLDALVRVAAQGRSLGVHLLLATQRPAGVVSAAVRANTALRVCLRVLDGADSRDVLGHEGAARLEAVPGRMLVEGSRHEGPLQALYAGDETEVSRVVAELRAAAGTAPSWRPWADPLPTRVTRREALRRVGSASGRLSSAGSDGARTGGPREPLGKGTVLLALTDLPEQQAQGTWAWDVREPLLVLGAAGSGRSTALASAALGALEQGVGVHLCGLPAEWEERLSGLEGVGTVVGAQDPRRVARLWSLAAAGGVEGVLVVDGAEDLLLAVDEVLGPTQGGALLDAVRRGCALSGTGLVVSTSLGSTGARWAGAVRTRLVLGADEPARAALAGLPRGRVGGRGAGRGVLLGAGEALDCQVLLPDGVTAWAPARAAAALPRLLPLPLRPRAGSYPRGTWAVGGDDAAPVRLPPGPVLVVGPHGSGRTTALGALARGAQEEDGGQPLVVDDLDDAPPQALEEVTRALADGRRVLASATTEHLAGAYRGPLADLRSRGAVVVLWPGTGPAAQAAGTSLRTGWDPRHPTAPGRGVLVHRGEVVPVQVVGGG